MSSCMSIPYSLLNEKQTEYKADTEQQLLTDRTWKEEQ